MSAVPAPSHPVAIPLSTSPSAASAATASSLSSSSASFSPKRVSFCPLALLIGVAGDGEIEQAMQQAQQQQLGKRKVAVRTYSIEAPNLGEVAGKAWHSVVSGFTASLEPFLNHGASSSSAGVCSRSPARSSSPERERDAVYAPMRSRSRSRSRSPSPGSRGRDPLPPYVREEVDPSFTPNPPARLKLKLPTLKRECTHPGSLLPGGCNKPILRRPSLPCDASPAPSFSPLATTLSTPSSSSPSTPHLFPTLSRTTSQPSCSPAHPQAGLIIPLAPCCAQCESATLYGSTAPESSYEERWSKTARKQREEDLKDREKRQGWEDDARRIAAQYGQGTSTGGGVEEKEAQQAEEEARGSRLAVRLAKEEGDVDDLKGKARVKHASAESDSLGSTLVGSADDEGMQDVEVVGVVEPLPSTSASSSAQDEPATLLATVITEEPADFPDFAALDSPPVALEPHKPGETTSSPPPAETADLPKADAPPSFAPHSSTEEQPTSALPRPGKRRLSSVASSSTSASPAPAPSPSLSQRISAFGTGFLSGASTGLTSPGVRLGF